MASVLRVLEVHLYFLPKLTVKIKVYFKQLRTHSDVLERKLLHNYLTPISIMSYGSDVLLAGIFLLICTQ